MATAKLKDEELADRALELFRSLGYEATSLNRIAEATGLEKASLYYRYPGGKEAIVMAVAERVGAWFEGNVFEPLRQGGEPTERIEFVVSRLRDFYGDGTKPCVLDTLSLAGGPEALQAALRGALEQWLNAFTGIAMENGLERAAAESCAEQALVEIEGSLVLGRVFGEKRFFLATLAGLAETLGAA